MAILIIPMMWYLLKFVLIVSIIWYIIKKLNIPIFKIIIAILFILSLIYVSIDTM